MALGVRWTESAWQDLEEVTDYIARDSRYYAAAFVVDVRDAARSLAAFANRGRVVPELGDQSIREIFISRYRLIYQVTPDAVNILAFIHGARDLTALWQRESR